MELEYEVTRGVCFEKEVFWYVKGYVYVNFLYK